MPKFQSLLSIFVIAFGSIFIESAVAAPLSGVNSVLIINDAKKNDPKAQFILAQMYEDGHDVKQDLSKAIEWYKRSAEQNYAPAQAKLGFMYYQGIGVSVDYEKAASLLAPAAENNIVQSQFYLGLMHIESLLKETDIDQGVQLLTAVTEQNDDLNLKEQAQSILGDLYFNGQYVEQDNDKAFNFFKQCHFVNCFKHLGDMYSQGVGTKQDLATAHVYYEKARKLALDNNDNQTLLDIDHSKIINICLQSNQNTCTFKETIETLTNLARNKYAQSLEQLIKSYIQLPDDDPKLNYFDLSLLSSFIKDDYAPAWNAVGMLFENNMIHRIIKTSNNASLLTSFSALLNTSNNSQFNSDNNIIAAECYKRANQQNYAPAQVSLAKMYLQGKIKDKSIDDAKNLLINAAQSGNIEAMYTLGSLHFQEGSNYNPQQAFSYFSKVVAQNTDPLLRSKAQAMLGIQYLQGKGALKDVAKAYELFTTSNTALSLNQLGIMHVQGLGIKKDLAQAATLFSEALNLAKQTHDIEAQGQAYYNQAIYICGTPEFKNCDFQQRVQLLNNAANANHIGAKDQLFEMYLNSKIKVQDFFRLNIYWIQQMASQSNGKALTLLGEIYASGILPDTPNFPLAVSYLKQGVKQNISRAKMILGIINLLGKTKPEVDEDDDSQEAKELIAALRNPKLNWNADRNLATDLIEEAAKDEYTEAQMLYGYMLLHGIEVFKRPSKASDFISAAANKGNAKAQSLLGFMYFEGLGVKQNIDLATKFYQKALEQKDSDAFVGLGLMYYSGVGITQDDIFAVQLFNKASYNNKMANLMLILMQRQNRIKNEPVEFTTALYSKLINQEEASLHQPFASTEELTTGFMLGLYKIDAKELAPVINDLKNECDTKKKLGACTLAEKLTKLNKGILSKIGL